MSVLRGIGGAEAPGFCATALTAAWNMRSQDRNDRCGARLRFQKSDTGHRYCRFNGLAWSGLTLRPRPLCGGVLFVRLDACFEAASKAGILQRRSNPEIYARASLANFRRRPIAPSAATPDSRSGRAAGSGTGVNVALPDP